MKMTPRAVYSQILFIDVPNPFVKRKTDSGLYIPQGLSQTQETGDVEQMDKMIGFGIVRAVGELCTHVKEGDAIWYQRSSVRPLPFSDVLFNCPEQGLVGYLPSEEVDFAGLQARMEEDEKEMMESTKRRREEERKAALKSKEGVSAVKVIKESEVKAKLAEQAAKSGIMLK